MNRAKESDAFVEIGSSVIEDSSQCEESSIFSSREPVDDSLDFDNSISTENSPLDSGLEVRRGLLDKIKSFGPAIYKRLKLDRLSTESIEATVFALNHKVDLINEVNTDAPPEGVKQLAMLMCIKDFDINLVFTEDGSFIDYEKVHILFEKYCC